jgi:hypothetical protein
VETVGVLVPGPEVGAVAAVVEVVTGAVVPVGADRSGGAVVVLIDGIVPDGPELGVPPLDVTGPVPPPVGPAAVLSVVTGAAWDV